MKIVQHGGTLIPEFDPAVVTHAIVDEICKGSFLENIGLKRLKDIPEHIHTVTWDWVISGFWWKPIKRADGYEYRMAKESDYPCFPQRLKCMPQRVDAQPKTDRSVAAAHEDALLKLNLHAPAALTPGSGRPTSMSARLAYTPTVANLDGNNSISDISCVLPLSLPPPLAILHLIFLSREGTLPSAPAYLPTPIRERPCSRSRLSPQRIHARLHRRSRLS